jgi:hypothetical protein
MSEKQTSPLVSEPFVNLPQTPRFRMNPQESHTGERRITMQSHKCADNRFTATLLHTLAPSLAPHRVDLPSVSLPIRS